MFLILKYSCFRVFYLSFCEGEMSRPNDSARLANGLIQIVHI